MNSCLINLNSLLIVYFILFFENTWEKHREFTNLFSNIHLVINGKGNQSLLNNTFYKEPYKVLVNSLPEDSCKKFCEMEYEINNVTLIFDDNVESCENMFYGLENITEIDLSKFNFSKVRNMSFMFKGCKN